MYTKLKLQWTIFLTFLKIGPVTFGGGYAMLSLIELEVVKKHKWIQEEEVVDIFGIAQSVPGAVAINSAIFVGSRIAGLAGALAALLGIMLPTLIIIFIVSISFYFFRDNQIVKAAFNGIGAAVIALIVHASYKVGKTAVIDFLTLVIAVLSLILLCLFTLNPIFIIIGGFSVGVLIFKIKASKGEEYRKTNDDTRYNVKDNV